MKPTIVTLALLFCATAAWSNDAAPGRLFADRPVAWFEHDDANVAVAPAANHLPDLDTTMVLRDGLANEVDRVLALEGRRPARDVNAADEVPCSTWFCARNHLHPMTPEEVAAGPRASAPVPPFKVLKGKDQGGTSGYPVVDATGARFMLKLNEAERPKMWTAGELVGYRFFHAAGYWVPGAFLVDIPPADLTLDPHATFKLYRVQKRPFTEQLFQAQLAHVGRLPDGRIRAAAVPWISGQPLGGFDLIGRRDDDPNDRIPHEDRRSLRASWVMFAWLSVMDPSAINTIDSYVEDGGRHFVRHYHFDFGDAFGSWSPHNQGEYPIEVGRSLRAFISLGLYHRPFEDDRAEWERLDAQYPALGYFPAETFNPDTFRGNRKLPTHVRMTDRDAYWGAKLVTSFTDAQIDAVVGKAGLPLIEATYLSHALRVRRDIIGRRYLRAMAAVEEPVVADDGASLCFSDLTIARRYAEPWEATYVVDVTDGQGGRLGKFERGAQDARTCLPFEGKTPGTGYRVVTIHTRMGAAGAGSPAQSTTKASYVHLRWRAGEKRFVVVGLERDE